MPEGRDLKELLDLEARRVEGNGHGLASVLRRADRRRRARRVGVAALAMAIAVSGTFGALRAFQFERERGRPANAPESLHSPRGANVPPMPDVTSEIGVTGFRIDVNVRRPRAVVRVVRGFLRTRKEGAGAGRYLSDRALKDYDAAGLKLYSERFTLGSIDAIEKIGDGRWEVSIEMFESDEDGLCTEQFDEVLTVAAVDDPPIRKVTTDAYGTIGCA